MNDPVERFEAVFLHLHAVKVEFDRLRALNAELLAALEDCVNGVGCQPGYISSLALKRADAAIAKARGEA